MVLIVLGNAGEEEEEGYEDDYQLEDLELAAADYIKAEAVSNFRNAWEAADADSEMTDDYGLGVKESLQVCSLHLTLRSHGLPLVSGSSNQLTFHGGLHPLWNG